MLTFVTFVNTSGLLGGVVIFLFFAMLQFKDGLFYRPHPAFWRVVKGMAIVYLVFLVWLLFQNSHDARHIWTYIDPKLGVPLPERDYATDCRIYTPESKVSKFENVLNTVYDEFMVAHVVGWFAKSFLFRDVYICWAWSILFELCELSLAHILPNFRECWWDQVILDVLICNAIGIFLGHLVMYHFEMNTFNWAGISENQGAPVARAFWPYNWTRFKWKIFSTPQRFFAIVFLIFLAAVIELNCFFLKYVLWHPPPHPLVFWRLVILWLFCLPALREYYQWVADPKCHRLGTMAWLSIAILGVEILVWVKFSKEMLAAAAPTPPLVIWAWSLAAAGIIIFAIVYFAIWKPISRKKKLALRQAELAAAEMKQKKNDTNMDSDEDSEDDREEKKKKKTPTTTAKKETTKKAGTSTSRKSAKTTPANEDKAAPISPRAKKSGRSSKQQ